MAKLGPNRAPPSYLRGQTKNGVPRIVLVKVLQDFVTTLTYTVPT